MGRRIPLTPIAANAFGHRVWTNPYVTIGAATNSQTST